MAQLRRDYVEFNKRNTVVIAVGPDTQKAFKNFWKKNGMPFIGLADPNHHVARLFDQEVNLRKFGRIPAQMIIDKTGKFTFVHYARSMSDIPKNADILHILDDMNQQI